MTVMNVVLDDLLCTSPELKVDDSVVFQEEVSEKNFMIAFITASFYSSTVQQKYITSLYIHIIYI